MRKIKLLAGIVLAFVLVFQANAQDTKKQPSTDLKRCATMEHLEAYFQENPQARQQAEQNMSRSGGTTPVNNSTNRLNAIVTIPVVIHVVLPNPTIITDADVIYFINRLNTDYSGLNPDSTNAGAFLPRRGHSQIRFCLARRTPAGQISTGVERKFSSAGSNANLAVDPIKRAAQGGLDSWDNLSYLNIWVGDDISGQGILGYATFPGTAGAADDGVFLNYQSFANNACYTIGAYNLGRTGSHEVGHYLGLYHIWGDEGACTGDDFRQLTGSCLYPTGLFNPAGQGNTASDVGDTPNQAGATTNCPTGVATDACATTAPGKMYQNYMDYTADGCYSMFTNKQVARMEWVVDNCRAGLKISLGCSAPTAFPATDAGLSTVVSPGGFDVTNSGCTYTVTPYPVPNCPASIVPRVSVTNFGVNNITSITATVTVGSTTSAPIVFPVSIAPNGSATLAFPAQNLISGSNTITFTITAVNGSTDTYTANNTLSTTVTVASGTFPFAQDFVTTTFPPPNMSVINPTGTNTWVRNVNGNGTAGSAFINNYNNGGGQIDDIRTIPLTPPAGATATDSLIISFDVAYRPYDLTATYADTLQVLVSTDCGATFTVVYNRSSRTTPVLSTGPATGLVSFTNPTGYWRRDRIALNGAYLTGGNIVVAFRNIARLGNNIFLDNINVDPKIVVRRDLRLLSINQLPTITCSTPAPSVTLQNIGRDTITAFKVAYSVDGGTPVSTTVSNVVFAPSATQTLNLGTITLSVGTPHTIRVYSFDPVSATGTGDQNLANDTLVRVVRVYGTQSAPLVEGFENSTFPPTGWVLNNPDGLLTWQRDTTAGRNSRSSVYVNNYNYPANGTRDELYAPQITYTGVDSVFLSFDVAATTYSYPGSTAIPLDTLEVLLTNDCGITYTSIYKKWGNLLQTVGDPNAPQTIEFRPTGRGQWRTEQINLSSYASRSPIQVMFRNTTNFENNIFIDNVNLNTKTLPAKLKEQGYLIYPTPFASSFYIQHYLSPIELRGVAVYNSIGQRVWAREYNTASTSSLIQVDLSRYANDVYTVVLRYTNRTISQKIIKAK